MSPGGWIESHDIGDLFDFDNRSDFTSAPFKEWWDAISVAFDIAGKSILVAAQIRTNLIAAGFEDVHEEIFRWPLSPWPTEKREKEIGLWSKENMCEALEAWALLPLTKYAGWTVDEVNKLCERSRQDLANPKNKYYFKM